MNSNIKHTRKIWTVQEREQLTELFANTHTQQVCNILNRSYSSVALQANLLGLKKSKTFLQKQATRLLKSGKAYRYPKGNIPANKGKKMPAELFQKCQATMFKKGKVPHNTKYDKHERISVDGYTEIRIAKGKYVLKHRHVWQQLKGEIPKGFIVAFKDGNQQNIKIENLELITRKENMLRNTIHRFPTELKSTIRLVNKLKRTINEK